MSATLHELPQATLVNVPTVLRAIADEIEAGAYGDVEVAAVVIENLTGEVRTFGAGAACSFYRAFALFHLGLGNLLAKRGEDHQL